MHRRRKGRQARRDEALGRIFAACKMQVDSLAASLARPETEAPEEGSCGVCGGDVSAINWGAIPASLRPGGGDHLDDQGLRAVRKQQQLEGMIRVLRDWHAIQEGDLVVDFGAGTGHLGILIAWLFPRCDVVCLERKAWTASVAEERAALGGLANCTVVCGGIDALEAYLSEGEGRSFNLGVGLHTCGLLTDVILECCVRHGAGFVLSPCCYGQIVEGGSTTGGDGQPRERPRSAAVGACQALDRTALAIVAKGADMSVKADDERFCSTAKYRTAKQCMEIVDLDRILWFREQAAEGTARLGMLTLSPPLCSPKNNVIVGVRPSPAAAVSRTGVS